jgi:RNA polymerase sigma-54 factor
VLRSSSSSIRWGLLADLRECLLVRRSTTGSTAGDRCSPTTWGIREEELRAHAALEVAVEEIYGVAQVVGASSRGPAATAWRRPRYIVPGVYVSKVGDGYVVQANDDGMPRLRISGFYCAVMAGDPKVKEYIQNKLRSAQWLIRSIDQRRKTIVRVTECIVEKQREFFDRGIEYLKPMILRDIAETVGMLRAPSRASPATNAPPARGLRAQVLLQLGHPSR